MSLMSLNAWFVIVAILSYVVISKYNESLAEAHLADQLACVLNTSSSCWEESVVGTPIRDNWERKVLDWEREETPNDRSDGKIIQAIYRGSHGEYHWRIIKRLGGFDKDGKLIFERIKNPRHLGIHNRGFRYLLNDGYQPDEE